MTEAPLKELFRFGPARRSVRGKVSRDGTQVVVKWTDAGVPKQQSWPNTAAGKKEARAFAEAFATERERIGETPQALTLRAMWTKYRESVEFQALARNSDRLYTDAWRRWELMWTGSQIAEQTTPEMADQFVHALEKRGLRISTIANTLRMIRRVYRWAEGRGLIGRNRLGLWQYKVSKAKKRVQAEQAPGEYSGDESARIIAQLSPTVRTQWRAWVALTICAAQGVRQNAALHLRFDDVDFELGRIHWRSEFDKMGHDWQQPLRAVTREALYVALGWTRGASEWVFPAGSRKNTSDPCYAKQSLWAALRRAEDRAGVVHRPYRAAHGLRRLLARDVAEITGDPMAGLHAIGDTDVRMAQHYLGKREDPIADAIGALDRELDRQRDAKESAE